MQDNLSTFLPSWMFIVGRLIDVKLLPTNKDDLLALSTRFLAIGVTEVCQEGSIWERYIHQFCISYMFRTVNC